MASDNEKWPVGTMRDGVRKVRLARESKNAGKDVIAYKVPYRDSMGTQTSKTWNTWKKATAFRNKIRSQKDSGILEDYRSKKTVREVAEKWMGTVEAMRRPETSSVYRTMLDLHIYPVLGDVPVRAVTKDDVQEVVNRWSKDRAARSVRLCFGVLSAVFQSAFDTDMIRKTPCTRIVLPELPRNRFVPLTPASVWAIANALRPDLRMMVLVGAMTGLRVGELRALTWDCIDFDRKMIDVVYQVQDREFCPLKTSSSYRSVPISPLLVRLLRKYRDTEGSVLADVPVRGDKPRRVELVFLSPGGRAQSNNLFTHKFRKVCEELKIQATVHTLRHTFASVMIDRNESPKKLQSWMGHSSISITMDVYGHLYPNSDDSVRNAIDEAFGDGEGE
ncbi:integrase [Murinocardiopsis flavida]|uniref:Integrase n=1 Tax=Murinocardiopsis flavida TaxID=645275 RepID=A0A2P8DGP6_9ACTN|nr:site-specific integrase [Murinocardiopsis flavida]PSK96407.1 integrase [Murinocardiopsis flavida]